MLFSLLSRSVQLSTIEQSLGIETGIIVTILGGIVASRYIETSLILASKCWYSWYLLRYQRDRTTLVVTSVIAGLQCFKVKNHNH